MYLLAKNVNFKIIGMIYETFLLLIFFFEKKIGYSDVNKPVELLIFASLEDSWLF